MEEHRIVAHAQGDGYVTMGQHYHAQQTRMSHVTQRGVQKSVFPVNQGLSAEREDSMNALRGPTVMAPVFRVRYVHQEVTTMHQKQEPATAVGPDTVALT